MGKLAEASYWSLTRAFIVLCVYASTAVGWSYNSSFSSNFGHVGDMATDTRYPLNVTTAREFAVMTAFLWLPLDGQVRLSVLGASSEGH